MSRWKEFMKEDEKAEEKPEVKEVIKPAVVKPKIERPKPIVHKEALSQEEIREYINKQIRKILGKEQKTVIKDYNWILDEFYQLKGYFRSYNKKEPEKSFLDRPNMKKAIENFEKHLREAINE